MHNHISYTLIFPIYKHLEHIILRLLKVRLKTFEINYH